MAAHLMAKEASNVQECLIWVEDTPVLLYLKFIWMLSHWTVVLSNESSVLVYLKKKKVSNLELFSFLYKKS